MTSNILVIHNPIAGRRRRRRLHQLLKILDGRGHHVRVKLTRWAGDAYEAARDCKDVDFIVAAGGDGTVNEVVNGLCSRSVQERVPAVVFLPLGTANVLAWELNLPRKPAAIASLIERGRTIDIRPGIANGRRFVLMASVGLDARAVAAVKTSVKRFIGGGAYVCAALKALGELPPSFHITADGHAYQARTVIVTRAGRYGGPFHLVPNADISDPVLYAVMMQGYGWGAAVRYGAALVAGRIHHLRDVHVIKVSKIDIKGPPFDPVQMDGDLMLSVPMSVALDDRIVVFMTAPQRDD